MKYRIENNIISNKSGINKDYYIDNISGIKMVA